MNMITHRKIRIGRSKKGDVQRFKVNIVQDYSHKPKAPTKKMKQILPILFKLKHNIDLYPPEKVLDVIQLIIEEDTTKFISPVEKEDLKNYLYKWGYDNSWVE